MEEVLTAERTEQAVSESTIYIMDRRAPNVSTAAAEEQSSEPPQEIAAEPPYIPRRRISPVERHGRVFFCTLMCILGAGLGVAVAILFPLSADDFSQSVVMSESGGFAGMLLRRLAQCGAFLLTEYIIGYFAAGGLFVWLAPLVYGLGAGLSAVGAFQLGGELLPVIFCVAYAAVVVSGAASSGDFSALLLRLVSGRNGSVVTDGAAAYHYTLRFLLYLTLTLALAFTEAWIRAAG